MQTDQVSELLADVADRLILPRFGALKSSDIQEKKPGDLVTVADREAEIELARVLRAAEPGVLVVGEEGVFTDPSCLDLLPTAEHAWVIDPVDGTRNFARGGADFAVMLAEVRNAVTVRGWIWQPEHEVAWVAELKNTLSLAILLAAAGAYLNLHVFDQGEFVAEERLHGANEVSDGLGR